jgi:hypothetical protein
VICAWARFRSEMSRAILDAPMIVPEASFRRNSQRNIQRATVLATTNRFVVVYTLSTTKALQDRWFFVLAIFRDQNVNGLADCFIGRVAEKPLRARVPRRNDPVEALADYCVIRRLHNRCKVSGCVPCKMSLIGSGCKGRKIGHHSQVFCIKTAFGCIV